MTNDDIQRVKQREFSFYGKARDAYATTYLVSSGGRHKIGVTRVPLERRIYRFREMQCPFPVHPVYEVSTIANYKLEQYLHALFAHRRVYGEWFVFDQEDIAMCKEEMDRWAAV